jgi:RecA-family ATPase
MDPLVSFGVGEQRVNDAEQGLIEAMRMLRGEFDCCVEGIHHSGKANAREKTLDQYAGRGGSAMADGARMVCVMQPLEANEWLAATGYYLEPDTTGIVMALPKMSYCRAQESIYLVRRGYAFDWVRPAAQPSVTDIQKDHDGQVYQVIKDAWLRNQPLSLQVVKDDYKALFYGNLKRDQVLEAIGRLKREGYVLQSESKGGRGAKSVLEPVIVNGEEVSKYAIPSEPGETQRSFPAG